MAEVVLIEPGHVVRAQKSLAGPVDWQHLYCANNESVRPPDSLLKMPARIRFLVSLAEFAEDSGGSTGQTDLQNSIASAYTGAVGKLDDDKCLNFVAGVWPARQLSTGGITIPGRSGSIQRHSDGQVPYVSPARPRSRRGFRGRDREFRQRERGAAGGRRGLVQSGHEQSRQQPVTRMTRASTE